MGIKLDKSIQDLQEMIDFYKENLVLLEMVYEKEPDSVYYRREVHTHRGIVFGLTLALIIIKRNQ